MRKKYIYVNFEHEKAPLSPFNSCDFDLILLS